MYQMCCFPKITTKNKKNPDNQSGFFFMLSLVFQSIKLSTMPCSKRTIACRKKYASCREKYSTRKRNYSICERKQNPCLRPCLCAFVSGLLLFELQAQKERVFLSKTRFGIGYNKKTFTTNVVKVLNEYGSYLLSRS